MVRVDDLAITGGLIAWGLILLAVLLVGGGGALWWWRRRRTGAADADVDAEDAGRMRKPWEKALMTSNGMLSVDRFQDGTYITERTVCFT